MTALAEEDAINVIDVGDMMCAVCAPIGMQREVIERRINQHYPPIDGPPWRIAPDLYYEGERLDNPCACESNDQRQHWLLKC